MILIDRKDELFMLHEFLAASRRGNGHVVLVSGSVGIGKSELLYAFAEEASATGSEVLRAVGRQEERDVPFGIVHQLVRDIPLPAPLRAQMTVLENSFATDPSARHESAALQAHVARGLCRALLHAAGAGGLLLCVDDVQHTDSASLSCLLQLLPHTRSAPVMLVFSRPDSARHCPPLLSTELLRHPLYRRVRLAPLSPAGTTELTTNALGTEEAQALGPVYHSLSGGNPLLVHALLRDHRDRLVDGAGDGETGSEVPPAGEEFAQAVLACLHGRDPDVLGVARTMALLDSCSSPDRIGRLLQLGPSSVANALRHMEAAGLVDDNRFRHPEARSAVLDDIPRGVISQQQLDVAELLHHEGLPTPTVARHLVAARHVPPCWAVPVLMDASEQARRSGDIGFALECLELALSGSDDAREQALTTMMLARLEWQLNPSMVMPRLGPLSEALLTGVLPAQLAVPLSRALLWHGRFDEAAEVIRALGPKVPGPHGLFTENREWLRNRYPTMVPLLPAAEDGSGIRDSREPAAARPVLLAETVLGSTLRNGGDESSAWSAEQVLRSCPLDDSTLYALESALLSLVYADRLGQASVWSAKLLQEATARQTPTWQAKLTAIRAELALRQGDLNEACTLARSAMTHLSPRSWGVAVGAPLSTLVLAATAMGADDVAEEYLRHSVPEAISESRYGLQYLYARGHHHLAAGRVHAALDDFLRCGDQARAWDMDLPSFLPWRSGAAAAHLRLGQRDQVRRLADAELARPGSAKSRSRGVAMCLLAEIAEPRRRASLLLEAVSVLRLTGDRLELARALAALSAAQRAIGEAEQARRALYQALHLADVCGVEHLQPSLPPRGREETPADPGTVPRDPLSAAERRVASLAALGNSNREIADQLCVTISTVEQHLTRVYRKLNVTRRADLPREFKALAVGTP
ncbi:helix-turn-helix transcriptional regulator [Streptomyces sp. ATCC 21386]|uniref:ATP-binding protein n=1 Tax=Streptomyces sp. ATCC 21386 TaxID=2699428 RepID=UPI00255C6911|nr:helix-turn-helix transcriptional regulator [Streptomyces sp. ATCC 21386]